MPVDPYPTPGVTPANWGQQLNDAIESRYQDALVVAAAAEAGAVAQVAADADDPGTAVGAALTATYASLSGGTVENAQLPAGLRVAARPHHVKDYGVDPANADNAAALATAFSTSAAAGAELDLGRGVINVASSVNMKDNLRAFGHGPETVIRASGTITTGILLAASGDTVSGVRLRDFVLDGDWTANARALRGIQHTAGGDVRLDRVGFRDFGRSAGLWQTGMTDVVLNDCYSTDTGLDGNTAGHAFNLTGVTGWVVRAARIRGSRAMGIAGTGSAGGEVLGGSIECVPHVSHTGYEAVGCDSSSPNVHVVGVDVISTEDNGISLSGTDCHAVGNLVRTCVNHGVHIGAGGVVSGNVIRNVGKAFLVDALDYGGVNLAGSDTVVVGNSFIDRQGTPTMGYGVKEQAGVDNNIIIGNRSKGHRLSPFLRVGANTLALTGTRPTVSGSRGGNAALASLLTALGTAGLVNDTTTA